MGRLVIPNMKKKKPGMLKSYLTSFELFLEYVTKKGSRLHLPKLDTEVFNPLFDLGNSLKSKAPPSYLMVCNYSVKCCPVPLLELKSVPFVRSFS